MFYNYGDGNYRQVNGENTLIKAVEVNVFAQGALQQSTVAVDRTPNRPNERQTLYL